MREGLELIDRQQDNKPGNVNGPGLSGGWGTPGDGGTRLLSLHSREADDLVITQLSAAGTQQIRTNLDFFQPGGSQLSFRRSLK